MGSEISPHLRGKMKKLLIILTILFMASTAWSAPFLVCDCQEDFQGNYELIFDGGSPVISPAQQYDCPDGQVRLSFDVAPLGLADGQHHLEGKAVNVWGESASVPFDFNKAVPSTQTGIGLSLTP